MNPKQFQKFQAFLVYLEETGAVLSLRPCDLLNPRVGFEAVVTRYNSSRAKETSVLVTGTSPEDALNVMVSRLIP